MREEAETGREEDASSNRGIEFGEGDDAPFGISFKKIIRGCAAKNRRPSRGRWAEEEGCVSPSYGM